jgi:ABC-type polysaccharide/polyol phosphate export permease
MTDTRADFVRDEWSRKNGPRTLTISPMQDIVGGLLQWRLWGRLGWLEVKRRYRRTIVGPFWTSVSLLVFVTVMSAVGSGLLTRETKEYLPFLLAGMVVWTMLASIMQESSTVFVAGTGLLRQMRFDYSVLVYALLWRNLVVFFHNMIVYFLIFIVFAPQKLTFVNLLAIPGMLLLLINGAWIAILVGMVASRFRDVQQMMQTLLQISMFITPLFWPPESLSGLRRIIFVGFNPLYHLLAIVRDPLLGNVPRLNNYIAATIITAAGWALTLYLFKRFRKRIAYWL